ncbi:MAG: hypothetical protein DMG08_20195 [Acidobacteria bacterium]|nr:MAG: hypothetical protein DMG08_20195 [Acidobacteriota bacterium]
MIGTFDDDAIVHAPDRVVRLQDYIPQKCRVPDYFPLRVLKTVLGESFTSRLNNNAREQTGTRTARDPRSTCAWRPARFTRPACGFGRTLVRARHAPCSAGTPEEGCPCRE